MKQNLHSIFGDQYRICYINFFVSGKIKFQAEYLAPKEGK